MLSDEAVMRTMHHLIDVGLQFSLYSFPFVHLVLVFVQFFFSMVKSLVKVFRFASKPDQLEFSCSKLGEWRTKA